MVRRKCIGSGFLGRKNRRTHKMCIVHLTEMDLPRKAHCSLCTDNASYGTDAVSYGTDTASYGTYAVSYGTDTASYGTDAVSYGTDTVSYGTDAISYGTDTVSYGTDTVSYGNDAVSYGTDTVSYGTDTVSYSRDMVSYGTDTVSYGSSDKKGLPGLCSVLPPASNVGVHCCTATRTVLSVLSHTLYNYWYHLQ